MNAAPQASVLAFRVGRFLDRPVLPGGTDIRGFATVAVGSEVFDGVQLVVNSRQRWDLFLPWGTGARRATVFAGARAQLLRVLVAAYEDEVANV